MQCYTIAYSQQVAKFRGGLDMYKVVLEKEAKKDLLQEGLNREELIEEIKRELNKKSFLEKQDILLEIKISDKKYIVVGIKQNAIITISYIISTILKA